MCREQRDTRGMAGGYKKLENIIDHAEEGQERSSKMPIILTMKLALLHSLTQSGSTIIYSTPIISVTVLVHNNN